MLETRVFLTWDVYATVRGSVALVASFPFKELTQADSLANRSLNGYVLKTRATRPITTATHYATPDPLAPVAVPVAVPLAPVAVPVFKVWDDVNERYVTCNGLPTDTVLTFPTHADAIAYATRLNQFGGYGGWASLRFHVREV